MSPNDFREFWRMHKTGGHGMGTGVQELKHAAKLQEWSSKVAECRSNGNSVKARCTERGISLKTYYSWEWQIAKEATEKYALPASMQSRLLMQVNLETMPDDDTRVTSSAIAICHGENSTTLSAGSCMESIAELVKALSRHF